MCSCLALSKHHLSPLLTSDGHDLLAFDLKHIDIKDVDWPWWTVENWGISPKSILQDHCSIIQWTEDVDLVPQWVVNPCLCEVKLPHAVPWAWASTWKREKLKARELAQLMLWTPGRTCGRLQPRARANQFQATNSRCALWGVQLGVSSISQIGVLCLHMFSHSTCWSSHIEYICVYIYHVYVCLIYTHPIYFLFTIWYIHSRLSNLCWQPATWVWPYHATIIV